MFTNRPHYIINHKLNYYIKSYINAHILPNRQILPLSPTLYAALLKSCNNDDNGKYNSDYIKPVIWNLNVVSNMCI